MSVGAARFESKREAGISTTRIDGSLYSRDVDEEAYAAEEYAAALFGTEPDPSIRMGDDGYDFALKVDVKWLGLGPNGCPRSSGHLIVNPYAKAWPDIFLVVTGSRSEGFRLLGWASRHDVQSQPLQDFGYGQKHALHTRHLRGFR